MLSNTASDEFSLRGIQPQNKSSAANTAERMQEDYDIHMEHIRCMRRIDVEEKEMKEKSVELSVTSESSGK